MYIINEIVENLAMYNEKVTIMQQQIKKHQIWYCFFEDAPKKDG